MKSSTNLFWNLVGFVSMFTYVYGHPIRLNVDFENQTQSTFHIMHENATCSDNCIFFFDEASLEKAKRALAEFLDMETPTGTKGMLLYVNLKTEDLTLLPDDQKLLNQFKQWQWAHANMDWYLKLPIDFDFSTFRLSASYEMNIPLQLKTNSTCCYINQTDVHAVRDLLSSDLFVNTSEKLLCNRFFKGQGWKTIFHYIFTTWVGYDLWCTGSINDVFYNKKIESVGSTVIPVFCFIIALYHPLIYKIIENTYIKRHFENIAKIKKAQKDDASTGRRREMGYFKGDSPYGFFRMTLKLFFTIKYESTTKISKLVPMLRLNILICLLYCLALLVPMSIEYKYDTEELSDFPDIYKFGLTVFYICDWKPLNIYWLQFANIGFVILIFFARIWSYIQLSESRAEDILFTVKHKCRKNQASDINNTPGTNKYENFTEDFLKISVYGKYFYSVKNFFSREFWMCSASCRSCKDCTCSWSRFFQLLLNFLNFVMMVFPGLLVMLFLFFNRIRKWCKFSCEECKCCKECCKNCESCTNCTCKDNTSCKDCETCKECTCKERTTFERCTCCERLACFNKSKACITCEKCTTPKQCFCEALCVFAGLLSCVLLYVELSILTFIVRSAMYIVFIVITNYEHFTRIIIIAFTCLGYIGSYIWKFVGKYTKILELMVEVHEDNIKKKPCQSKNENSQSKEENLVHEDNIKKKPCQSKNENSQSKEENLEDPPVFIYEEDFDHVIAECHLLHEQLYILVLKVLVTLMFFVVAIVILLDSRQLEQTKQLNNVIELIVIIITPQLFLKCFEKDTKVTIEEHKDEIKKHTKIL